MPDNESATIVRQHVVVSASLFPLAYREYLPPGAVRSDIVLVHGLASSGLQFHEEALRFASKGHRVLVPDLRGHGISGVPQGTIRVADFSIPVMAGDVIEMLDHAGAHSVHWVGNSLGGILALWLLGTSDQHRLRSLVLFGTCFSMNLPRQVNQALRLSFLPGARLTAWLTARTTTASPLGRRCIATSIRQFNIEAGAAIATNVRSYDFVTNIRGYHRPLLVLWGGKDYAVNLGLRGDVGKFADQPNFTRIDLPDGGHCSNFDMPDAFRAALEQHWTLAELEIVGSHLRSGERS